MVPEMAAETAKVEPPFPETIDLTAISLRDAASPVPVDAQSHEAPAAPSTGKSRRGRSRKWVRKQPRSNPRSLRLSI